MFSAIPNHEQLVALHKAFEKACLELGLGPDQAVRREQLEQIIVSLSDRGERDADLIGTKCDLPHRDSSIRCKICISVCW